jgi:hypothetical protein
VYIVLTLSRTNFETNSGRPGDGAERAIRECTRAQEVVLLS